jgi:hypothetical protein
MRLVGFTFLHFVAAEFAIHVVTLLVSLNKKDRGKGKHAPITLDSTTCNLHCVSSVSRHLVVIKSVYWEPGIRNKLQRLSFLRGISYVIDAYAL